MKRLALLLLLCSTLLLWDGAPRAVAQSTDPLCAKYAGVLLGRMRGQPMRPECGHLKELTTDAEDVRLSAAIADDVFELHGMASQRPMDQVAATANGRCRRIQTSIRSYYACTVTSSVTIFFPLAPDGWAESLELEIDLETETRAQLPQLDDPTEAVFQLFGDVLLASNARVSKPLPLQMRRRKLVAHLPITRASAATQATDHLCAKYAGVLLGKLQGQPVRHDCAGIQAVAAAAQTLPKSLADVADALVGIVRATPQGQPFAAYLSTAEPDIARSCKTATRQRRSVYACAVNDAIDASFLLAPDGRVESLEIEVDVEIMTDRVVAPMTDLTPAAYELLGAAVMEANSRAQQPVPLRLSGRKLRLSQPVKQK